MTTASALQKRTFDSPDEVRPAGRGSARIINAAQVGLMHVTLPPGWRWSTDVKPLAHTGTCQAPHLIYVLSGRIHVVMEDGTENEYGPTDVGVVPPGHDAWTLGNEPVVYLDITGSSVWARPQ
jgi:quercetin dioxygenase-like cupin family protein